MEKEIQEVINKINELKGKELGLYIDSLLVEDNEKIMKNKEVLLAIAQRVNGFGYHQRMIREKFRDIGLNMQDELNKRDREKTIMFLEQNPELNEVINIATKWWVSAIKKPYFANYDNMKIPIEMGVYFQLDSQERKIEKENQLKLTPEKEKLFTEALTYEIADSIRKEGSCRLRVDTYGFDAIAKALEASNLRVHFPKRINMLVTSEEIKLANSMGNFDVVYEVENKSDKNNSHKKM